MPLPNESDRRKEISLLRKEMHLPKGWKIDYQVKPWLGFDMRYDVDKESKIVSILVYSARYPETFYQWYKELCAELRGKMGW